MGGPVLWLAGLYCVLLLAWRQLTGRGSRRGAAVLVLYAAQLVPWMFVARCTFLYHYFPSSMFCLAAIAVVLADMQTRKRPGAQPPAWWGRRWCCLCGFIRIVRPAGAHGLGGQHAVAASWGFYWI